MLTPLVIVIASPAMQVHVSKGSVSVTLPVSMKAGKWYYEVTLRANSTANARFGWGLLGDAVRSHIRHHSVTPRSQRQRQHHSTTDLLSCQWTNGAANRGPDPVWGHACVRACVRGAGGGGSTE
jgi:hypothetical protein